MTVVETSGWRIVLVTALCVACDRQTGASGSPSGEARTQLPEPSPTPTAASEDRPLRRYKVDGGRFSVALPQEPTTGQAGAMTWADLTDDLGDYFLVACAPAAAPGYIEPVSDFAESTLKSRGPAITAIGSNGGENRYPFFNGQVVSELVWTFSDGTQKRERAVGFKNRTCEWYAIAKTAVGKQRARTFAESFQPVPRSAD